MSITILKYVYVRPYACDITITYIQKNTHTITHTHHLRLDKSNNIRPNSDKATYVLFILDNEDTHMQSILIQTYNTQTKKNVFNSYTYTKQVKPHKNDTIANKTKYCTSEHLSSQRWTHLYLTEE